jgi:hypothetical protein
MPNRRAAPGHGVVKRADLPKAPIFMLSQNGRAKANPLNMHTKALIRAFDKPLRVPIQNGLNRAALQD